MVVSLIADCYDPLDPNGNVTVVFDILQWTHDGYVARVSIENYYQYRHVDKPGWKLGFTWSNTEVIWSINGAIATQQGNCSSFKDEIPHCCIPTPQIVDLTRGGLLTARAINAPQSSSSFSMVVGNLQVNSPLQMPVNLTLLAPGPGYTCSPLEETEPTVFLLSLEDKEKNKFLEHGKQHARILVIWLTKRPASSEFTSSTDTVRCSDHMCPIRVHWHIKTNYMDHWRVKLTVTNLNYDKNYTNWNVLVNHPGFGPSAMSYSFNSTLLHTAGIPDDLALFWGVDYYNTDLLNANKDGVGSVSTEIVLAKDPATFTLHNGWGFPRTIYFGGENCVMPPPHTFPMLPNAVDASSPSSTLTLIFLLLIYFNFTN
ncbi:hypothetical protein OSB04_025375 [Centaurea solstitialis]|uniref:COBRA C-terminal domain-containing protein n=1 Tax=Centaurea solstitialis TaxID=347529 RepID=A0AA38SNK5_9ASTR|nr:hypothetical protein OSB04_025375 [Centaurea solstitialis]